MVQSRHTVHMKYNKKSSEILEFSGRFLLTTIISVGVPLASSYMFSSAILPIDQLFIGLFVFVIGTLVQISVEITNLRKIKEAEFSLWEIESEIDVSLNNIRKSYSDILRMQNPLYKLYFQQRIRHLYDSITKASANEELLVDQDADTTEMMLRGFSGQPDHIIRVVHYLKDNNFLFDVHASHFFCEVARLVKDGKITEVRRLFIAENEDDLKEERSKKLIQFHSNTVSFSCQAMYKDGFEKLKRDYHLPMNTYDFGIYGTMYVYRSSISAPDEVKGTFNASSLEVSRFISFFDRCWSSQAVIIIDVDKKEVTLKELFGKTSVSPNRPGIKQIT
jgi:hypothetical protein